MVGIMISLSIGNDFNILFDWYLMFQFHLFKIYWYWQRIFHEKMSISSYFVSSMFNTKVSAVIPHICCSFMNSIRLSVQVRIVPRMNVIPLVSLENLFFLALNFILNIPLLVTRNLNFWCNGWEFQVIKIIIIKLFVFSYLNLRLNLVF
jgi:hypothetical protein